MGMRQTPSPDSEATGSSFVNTGSGNPLTLRMQVRYEANDDYPDEIIDEWEQTNIRTKVRYVREIPPSASARRHMEPVYFALGRFGTNAGFDNINALTVTFRYRRVKPRGNEGV